MVPYEITVRRTENRRYRQSGVSRVRHYDEAMMEVFPYFLVVTGPLATKLTEKLGAGFSKDGYGPFWPSFASMNYGSDTYKVVWISKAGLECLQETAGPGILLQVEERDPALVDYEMRNA